MAKSRKKRPAAAGESAEFEAHGAVQKVFHWRRWLLLLVAVMLIATGVVRLRRQDGQSTLEIDFKRAAEVERSAAEHIRAAKARWNGNR
jgi:hypothetical protein